MSDVKFKSLTQTIYIYFSSAINYTHSIPTSTVAIFITIVIIWSIAEVSEKITFYVLKYIFFVNDETTASISNSSKLTNSQNRIVKSDRDRLLSGTRILFLSRAVRLVVITVYAHGVVAYLTSNVSTFEIPVISGIFILSSTIKSSIGAGLWILLSNDIAVGDLFTIESDKDAILRVVYFGWFDITCHQVNRTIGGKSNQKTEESTKTTVRMPNSRFLSEMKYFYGIH